MTRQQEMTEAEMVNKARLEHIARLNKMRMELVGKNLRRAERTVMNLREQCKEYDNRVEAGL